MSRSYDIFLSHSGAQKEFVEHLNAELGRVCGHYSVFFDRDAIQHGEQISATILEYAKSCKLAVAVLSEEYFTKSRWPMMELAASYAASKDGDDVPCLFPVFLVLRPEDAKDHSVQLEWQRTWHKWELNEKMSERRKSRPSRVQPAVWKEAADRLLDTRGPVYKPHENDYDPEIFLKKVAQLIARKVDVLSRSPQQDEVRREMFQFFVFKWFSVMERCQDSNWSPEYCRWLTFRRKMSRQTWLRVWSFKELDLCFAEEMT